MPDNIMNPLAPIMPDVQRLIGTYNGLRKTNGEQDKIRTNVRDILDGKWGGINPDMFPAAGEYDSPVIGNQLDVIVRSVGEQVGAMPTISAAAPANGDKGATDRANTKTEVLMGYAMMSKLPRELLRSGTEFVAYGFTPWIVDIDMERKSPYLRRLNPVGCYYNHDAFGRIRDFFQTGTFNMDWIKENYPQYTFAVQNINRKQDMVDVVFYHNKDWSAYIALSREATQKPIMLAYYANPIGEVMVRVAERVHTGPVVRGQVDDLIDGQMAINKLAMLNMQAVWQNVNSPLLVGNDIKDDIEYGPGVVIGMENPQGATRAPGVDISGSYQEQQTLANYMNINGRFPATRTGNSDASIITGNAVRQLEAGFDLSTTTYQTILADVISDLNGIMLKVDEKFFGGQEKTVDYIVSGVPYQVTYDPAKVIAGDYSNQVQYGLLAGLAPNQLMVVLEQAKSTGAISNEFFRKNMPLSTNPNLESKLINQEKISAWADTMVGTYLTSLGQLALQGQDVSGQAALFADLLKGVNGGKDVIELLPKLFPVAPPAPAAPDPTVPQEQAAGAGDLQAAGLQSGNVGPGSVEGSMPSMRQALTSITSAGKASATIRTNQSSAF